MLGCMHQAPPPNPPAVTLSSILPHTRVTLTSHNRCMYSTFHSSFVRSVGARCTIQYLTRRAGGRRCREIEETARIIKRRAGVVDDEDATRGRCHVERDEVGARDDVTNLAAAATTPPAAVPPGSRMPSLRRRAYQVLISFVACARRSIHDAATHLPYTTFIRRRLPHLTYDPRLSEKHSYPGSDFCFNNCLACMLLSLPIFTLRHEILDRFSFSVAS